MPKADLNIGITVTRPIRELDLSQDTIYATSRLELGFMQWLTSRLNRSCSTPSDLRDFYAQSAGFARYTTKSESAG